MHWSRRLCEQPGPIELGLGIIAEENRHLDRQAQPHIAVPHPEPVQNPRHALLMQDLHESGITQGQMEREICDLQAYAFPLLRAVGLPFQR